MESHKTCSKCAASKPVSEFFFKDVAKTKYRSWCKPCGKDGIKNRVMTPEVAEALKVKERARNKVRSAYMYEYQKAYTALHKDHLNAMSRAREASKPKPIKPVPTSSDVFFLLCQHTGALFTAKTDTAKYCTEGIRLVGLERAKRYEARLHDKLQRTYTCKQCEHPFTPAYATKKRTYCSDACTAAAMLDFNRGTSNHRKRARFYGVAYEPIRVSVVFTLAGWHCQGCGIATPLAKRGSYDDGAPELDHIIPISKGGPHLYSNVQCLCRRCNIDKGDKTLPNYIGVGLCIVQANTPPNQCLTP